MKHVIQPVALVSLYVAVAVAATWPLAQSFTTALPIGCERVATVPLLNAWTVWWNADRAARGYAHYWDAPIFHPTQTTFVFSEAQPTTIVVAPVVWTTGNVVLAYNLYFLATLTLNGWCAHRLLRRVGLGAWAACGGGVMTQILPFVFWQLGVLQLTVLWGVLWTVQAAWSFAQLHGWWRAVELGAAFGVTYAACNYYGLFLAAVLGPSAVWMLHREWLKPRVWLQTLLAALVAAALVFPIVSVQRQTSKAQGWKREWTQIRNLSAHLRDYTDTPWPQWLDVLEDNTKPRADDWVLGPGWLKVFAAAIGLACGLARPALRRWTLVAATMGTLSLFYSLGPLMELWNLTPYKFLFDSVPGFAQIRSPFRFAMFVQLAVVWLATIAVDTLWRFNRRAAHEVSGCGAPLTSCAALLRLALRAGSIALGLCLICETLPISNDPNVHLRQLPSQTELPPWVDYLRDETPHDAAVVCLPFVKGTEVGAYEDTTWWMWWSTFHHRPLINGYSGYFPEPFLTLKAELEHFPNQGAPRLVEMGAQYAVVQRHGWTRAALAKHPQTAHWEWRFGDDLAQLDVYEIPDAPESVPVTSE